MILGEGSAVIVALHIEKINLCRRGTVITRTRPMKAVSAVSDGAPVRRVIGVIHFREVLAQHLGLQRLHVKRVESVIGRVAFAGKEQLLSVRAPAVGDFGTGMVGQLSRLSAVGRYREDVPVAIATRGEGNPFAVRREERIGIGFEMLSQWRSASTG